MAVSIGTTISRKELAQAFKDPRLVILIESVIKAVAETLPEATNAAQATGASAAQQAQEASAAAGAANTSVAALKAPSYVVGASSGTLDNERVLTGDVGLTVDQATAGLIKLVLDVAASLGYSPADRAGDTFTGPVILSGGVRLGGYAGNADAPVNGYITVLDSTGASRKLATIA